VTDDPLQNYNEWLTHSPATYCPGRWRPAPEKVQYPRNGAIAAYRSGRIVSISNYSPPYGQPATSRQIVVLGVVFALVVAGLIAFNLILERVSLLDDLNKDVRALAQVHAGQAEREIRVYDALLGMLAERVRRGDGFGDLIPRLQSFDAALVEARVIEPCVPAAQANCPAPLIRMPGKGMSGAGMPGLVMDALPGAGPGTKILIARRLDPDAGTAPAGSGDRMIALTLDLGGLARGLQGTMDTLDLSVAFAPGPVEDGGAVGAGSGLGGDRAGATVRVSNLPLAVSVSMPVHKEMELWRHHVATGAALAAILAAGIAGAVRILLWLSDRQHEAIARVYRSERALSEEVSLQQSLIDAIPLPLSMRNEKGIFIRCNRAFLELTLRRRDEVLGRTSAELFGRETAVEFDQGIEEALARSTPIRFEMSLTDAIGARRDVNIYRSAHRHADGVGVTIVSVTVDETERRRVESALRESEERFHLAVQGSNDGIWDWDLRTGRIWFSARWKEMLGYGEDELEDTLDMWAGVIFEEDRIAALKLVEDYNLGRVPNFLATQRFHHRQGHTCYILSRAAHLKDENGVPIRLVGAHTDITEMKRIEASVRDQVVFLSTLLDTIPSPIYYKNADGVYIGCNRAFAAIHGVSVGQVVGRRPGDLMKPETAALDDNADACLMAIQDAFQVYETQLDFADGSRHDVLYSKALFRQSSGEVGGLVGVMTDTTDRTRHEQEIADAHRRMARQAEDLKRSNAELEQFAYVASHDLREPLRMVNSYLSLLQRRYGDKLDDDAKEFIGFARDGGVRMDRLILDLLEYSRVGRRSKPMAPTPLNDVVASACQNLEVAIGERGTILHVPGDLPTVQADSNELTRLLQNLIGNAIKYCAPDTVPEISVDWADEPEHWRISVRDNGLGIAPEHFERVFMVFQRLHGRGEYEGTGIGLAICRKIVEHHGGRIWLTSEPGKGSTFHFTLAKQVAERQAAETQAA
jgi:PAS domain S-box-containing protein